MFQYLFILQDDRSSDQSSPEVIQPLKKQKLKSSTSLPRESTSRVSVTQKKPKSQIAQSSQSRQDNPQPSTSNPEPCISTTDELPAELNSDEV